jgi:hypothetical protein
MPDSKITALTSIGASTDPANDPLVLVDVSDTSMAASGTTKKVTLNQLLGASGTATLASATISGDLTVDTSTLKVDSANNRVGIGTATPSAALEVADAGSNTRVRINSTSVVATEYFRSGVGLWLVGSDSTNAFKIARGSNFGGSADYFAIASADAAATWYDAAGGTRMTLNSTGLGVGVSPSYKLHVTDNTTGLQARLSSTSTSGTSLEFQNTGAGGRSWRIGSGFAVTAGNFEIYDSTAAANRLSIDSSGNVGVGVTPSAWGSSYKSIDIAGGAALSGLSTQTFLTCNAYDSSGWKKKASGYANLLLNSNGEYRFYVSNAGAGAAGDAITFTQAMTLDASGNLLVGTTSASNQERLNITSNRNVYISRFFNSASSGGNYGFLINYSAAAPNNASNEFLACSDNAASRLFLYSNGGIANYQANDANLSDIRTKTDIKPLASYWNKIKALELVTFKYKDQTHSDDNIGLIAQQVESVAPEFIDADGFGETPSDGVPLKTIYTTDLYHASIKALQEAMARIEALEAKLA